MGKRINTDVIIYPDSMWVLKSDTRMKSPFSHRRFKVTSRFCMRVDDKTEISGVRLHEFSVSSGGGSIYLAKEYFLKYFKLAPEDLRGKQ